MAKYVSEDNLSYYTSLVQGMPDNKTIEYAAQDGQGAKSLRVKDGGIGTQQLAQGVIDAITKPKPGKDIGAYSWQELIDMANDDDIDLADLDYLIGQSRNILIVGYGTFAFQLIGIGHDSLASGGTSNLLTFQSIDIVCNHNMNSTSTTSGGWASSSMRTFMNGDLLSKFPQYILDVIKEVKKPYCATANGAVQYSNDKLFIASEMEIYGTSDYGNEGTRYEYWSNETFHKKKKRTADEYSAWWTRTVRDAQRFKTVSEYGKSSHELAETSVGCVPCFCI